MEEIKVRWIQMGKQMTEWLMHVWVMGRLMGGWMSS